MSMQSWHNYGFGINVDKIQTTDEKLRAYIDRHPQLKTEIISYICNENGCSNDGADTENSVLTQLYSEYGIEQLDELYKYYTDEGINGIIREAIEEETGIPLVSCCNCNSEESFVIMPSYYPWEVNNNPILQTINSEKNIKAIFANSLSHLTNQTLDELDWGEQNVEGCD